MIFEKVPRAFNDNAARFVLEHRHTARDEVPVERLAALGFVFVEVSAGVVCDGETRFGTSVDSKT